MTPQEMAVWINLYRKNDEQYSDKYLRECSEMLNKLHTENIKLNKEVTRYKMAWNMAEDTIEKLNETIKELEYVNEFGDLEKER